MIDIPQFMHDDAKEAAKDFYKQTHEGEPLQRDWHRDGKYIGNLCEIAFSMWLDDRLDIMLGYEIWNQGRTDGGYDFRFRKRNGEVWWIDVKARRHKKFLVKLFGPAFYERTIFVDIHWNESKKLATPYGWAYASDLRGVAPEKSQYKHWNIDLSDKRRPMPALLGMLRNEFNSELLTKEPGKHGTERCDFFNIKPPQEN